MKILVLILISSFSLYAEVFQCTDNLVSNLRAEPSTHAQIVARLPKYTPVIVTETNEKWTHIKTSTHTGWIYNTLLSNHIKCVQSIKSNQTYRSFSSQEVYARRKRIPINEGFKILETKIGMTKVRDKSGHVFWLENRILWPKKNLNSLEL